MLSAPASWAVAAAFCLPAAFWRACSPQEGGGRFCGARDAAGVSKWNAQVRLRDPTGPGAGSSRKYRDAFGYNLRHGLAQRRPSDGFDHINRRLAHEVGSVVSEKYLHVMPGSPRTPHQNVQLLLGCLRLLSLRLAGGSGNDPGGERASSELRRFFKKVSASCPTPPPAIGRTLHELGAECKLLLIAS